MSFAPGQVIAGKYEIIRVLGEGGMGIVFQARHLELGGFVAIKVLRDEVMQDSEAVRRFYREAQAAAVLSGEHVARVLDVGRLEGERPYLVMEYLSGSDLGVILEKRQRLPVGEAVDYIIQACEALDDAHRAGVVHRDLKPANLFVVEVGNRRMVKLVDFGISRFDRPNEVRVTQTQTAFGTPLYMAPESVRSAKLADARTDLWALGVILYELLAGVPPFLGDTPTSVAVSITIDKQKPLSDVRLDVPAELDAIIGWALEKDPARRPQSAAELAEALRPFRDPARLSLPGGMLSPGDPQAITARSMTPGLARTDQTMRTGDPVSRDAPREKKSRLGIVVAAAAMGLLASVAIIFMLRLGDIGSAAKQGAPAHETAKPEEPPTTAVQPGDKPIVATSRSPAPAENAAVSATSAATDTPSATTAAKADADPRDKKEKPAAAPPAATSEPAPSAQKPKAPQAPGGNPLIL